MILFFSASISADRSIPDADGMETPDILALAASIMGRTAATSASLRTLLAGLERFIAPDMAFCEIFTSFMYLPIFALTFSSAILLRAFKAIAMLVVIEFATLIISKFAFACINPLMESLRSISAFTAIS